MKNIFLLIGLIAIMGCQSRRITSFRVEDQNGNPISEASIGFTPMNSGHPLYPEVKTGDDGIAHLQDSVVVGRSFLYSVISEDGWYSFRHTDLIWQGNVPVLQLKEKYAISLTNDGTKPFVFGAPRRGPMR